MALQYEDQIKIVEAGTTLSLTPTDTQSIKVKRIGATSSTADTTLTVVTDRSKVGFYYINARGIQLLGNPIADTTQTPFYNSRLMDSVNFEYPVANGEVFTLTASANSDMIVIYDIYDRDDIKNTDPNGSKSGVCNYIGYITTAANFVPGTSEAYKAYDTNLNPNEFLKFPLDNIPPGVEIDIHAIGAIALSRGDGSVNLAYSKHHRIKYNREVLYDPLGVGWVTKGNSAYTTASYSYTQTLNMLPPSENYQANIFQFKTPKTFVEGDVLVCELGAIGTAAGALEAGKPLMFLVMTQRSK